MALISCSECRKEISTEAATCPGCGAPNKSLQIKPQDKASKPKTRPIFKALAAIIVFLFILALFGKPNAPAGNAAPTSSSTETATQEQQAPQEPPVEVNAKALSADYNANEVSADMKFKGKRLHVTGIVASINKDFAGDVWVGIAAENQFMPIHAEGFSPEQVSELKKGYQVKITCTGAGMVVGSPILKGCS